MCLDPLSGDESEQHGATVMLQCHHTHAFHARCLHGHWRAALAHWDVDGPRPLQRCPVCRHACCAYDIEHTEHSEMSRRAVEEAAQTRRAELAREARDWAPLPPAGGVPGAGRRSVAADAPAALHPQPVAGQWHVCDRVEI